MNSIKLCALQNGKLKCLNVADLFVGHTYSIQRTLGLGAGTVRILDRSGTVVAESNGNQISLDTPGFERLFSLRPIGYRMTLTITHTEADGGYSAGEVGVIKAG